MIFRNRMGWQGPLPSVYRHTERQFVRSFFDRGELFLSTYARCREIEDMTRRDEGEGKGSPLVQMPDGHALAMRTHVGSRSYILCTSLSDGLDHLENADESFLIVDVEGFGRAVGEAIGAEECMVGPMDYSDTSRERIYPGDAFPLPEFLIREGHRPTVQDAEEFVRQISAAIPQQASEDVFFSKPASFAREQEFRFVWRMPETAEPVAPSVKVVTAAAPFCKAL